MNEIVEYAKCNVSNSAHNMYDKFKNTGDFEKGVIRMQLLQTLKADCSLLDRENIDRAATADFIINLAKVIENWDELQPTLQKYFSEQAREKKFKEIELIEE